MFEADLTDLRAPEAAGAFGVLSLRDLRPPNLLEKFEDHQVPHLHEHHVDASYAGKNPLVKCCDVCLQARSDQKSREERQRRQMMTEDCNHLTRPVVHVQSFNPFQEEVAEETARQICRTHVQAVVLLYCQTLNPEFSTLTLQPFKRNPTKHLFFFFCCSAQRLFGLLRGQGLLLILCEHLPARGAQYVLQA